MDGLTYSTKGLNNDNGDEVAIKLEYGSMGNCTLQDEIYCYKTLAGGAGIPRVHWDGQEGDYNVMVFDLLGPSLEDLFDFCGRIFSLKTVLMVANQLIYRINYIHSKQIIHRDIKPENILMGVHRRGNQVYITDMGISMEFEPLKGDYTAPKDASLVGSTLFASLRGHLGGSK